MDKEEFRIKLEQINHLVEAKDYKGAMEVVDSIDWRRVKNVRTLCVVGEIYAANKRYEDSRDIFLLAYHRASIGKNILYRLIEVSLKMGEIDEAMDYYEEFCSVAPNDNTAYVLRYKILKARNAPIEDQIQVLEEYKNREFTEKWSYELAKLYYRAGDKEKCSDLCSEIILWFSEGSYVMKAYEMKSRMGTLTEREKENYEKALEEIEQQRKASEEKEKEKEKEEEKPKEQEPVIEEIEIKKEKKKKPKKEAEKKTEETEYAESEEEEAEEVSEESEEEEAEEVSEESEEEEAEEVPEEPEEEETEEVSEEPEEEETEEVSEESGVKKEKLFFEEISEEETEEVSEKSEKEKKEKVPEKSGVKKEKKFFEEILIAEEDEKVSEVIEILPEEEPSEEEDNEIIEEKVIESVEESDEEDADEEQSEEYEDLGDEPEGDEEVYDEEEEDEENEEDEDDYEDSEASSVDDEDSEIESIYVDDSRDIESTETLQEKIVRGIRDLFGGKKKENKKDDDDENGEYDDDAEYDEEYDDEYNDEEEGETEEDLTGEDSEEESGQDEESSDEEESEEDEESSDEEESEEDEKSSDEEESEDEEESSDEEESEEDEEPSDEEESEDGDEEYSDEDESEDEDESREKHNIFKNFIFRNKKIKNKEIQDDDEESETEKETDHEESGKVSDSENEYSDKQDDIDEEFTDSDDESEEQDEKSENKKKEFRLPSFRIPKSKKRKTAKEEEEPVEKPAPVEEISQEDMPQDISDEILEDTKKAEEEKEVFNLEDTILAAAFAQGIEIPGAGPKEPEKKEPEEEIPEEDDGELIIPEEDILEEFPEHDEETAKRVPDLIMPDLNNILEENEFDSEVVPSEEEQDVKKNDDDFVAEIIEGENEEDEDEEELLVTGFIGIDDDDEEEELDELSEDEDEEDEDEDDTIEDFMDLIQPDENPSDSVPIIPRGKDLSEEEKKLFSYFVKVPGMKEQIIDTLYDVQMEASKKNSSSGNVIVMGGPESGKTRLISGLIPAICKELDLKAAKVAYVFADQINGKDIDQIIAKLAGGFLVIENANQLDQETADKLNSAMEGDTKGMIFILEDEKIGMRKMMARYPKFARKFTSSINIPVFTNDELAYFAKIYAMENGYRIDNNAMISLYNLISINQKEDVPMNIGAVKELVDAAIQKSRGKLGLRKNKKRTDEDGFIILYEKDFVKGK